MPLRTTFPLIGLSLSVLLLHSCAQNKPVLHYPSDYLFQQRAYPSGTINREAWKTALLQAESMQRATIFNRNAETWESVGPTNVGGRISGIAVDPQQPQTLYIGAASGGVWKTTDEGLNWTPVFDESPTLSIGDIALAPSQPQTLYVGTGEANAGGGSLSYDGMGMYKSVNGGNSWENIGLENAGSIGKIIVDPVNPQRVFAATMGYLFENNPERGVYRTLDGGANWEKVLFVNDSTGAVDLAFHPGSPDTIYAATWQRIRRPDRRQYGGPGCGIWRSDDGGTNWHKLNNGLPVSDIGRIGIAVSPDEPDMLLAVYADESGDYKSVYKSLDKGAHWTAYSGQSISYNGFGWWFGKIVADPSNAGRVYVLGVDLHRSLNGGANFTDVQPFDVHVDNHALYIDPANPNRMILGNDGGLYLSTDGGQSWAFRSNIPITQFYTCEIDFQNPEILQGGVQDNGTWRTPDGQPDAFEHIYGGDGFYTLINPDNPDNMYAEYQYGSLGVSQTGPYGFSSVAGQITGRKNWNMPVILDPNNPSVAYCGSESLFRSLDNGQNWTPISPDLTNGPTGGNLVYASISSIGVSAAAGNVIWVGTDDGNVQVSTDGGSNWTLVSADLPLRWVTRVVADPFDAQTAYVCFSGYRYNDYLPHVFKTTDLGNSWQDISGNLPEAPVNDLIVDPGNPDRLYLATDVGVFQSWNGGAQWSVMAPGLPTVPVTDLDFHDTERFLIAATYGRSMYKINVGPPVSATSGVIQNQLFRVMPNPMQQTGTVELNLSEKQRLSIGLYDLQGKRVLHLFEGELPAGKHNFGVNQALPGTYVMRAMGEKLMQAEKVVVLR